jgi:glycosyltransferase involved in cell wall biosynthesis
MASGRPAIFVGPAESDTGETVITAACGVVIDPAIQGAATRIVETIAQWSSARDTVMELGRNGREAFLETFERARCCEAFADIVAGA